MPKSVLKKVSVYPATKTKQDEDPETAAATDRQPKTQFTEVDEVILTISINCYKNKYTTYILDLARPHDVD